MGSTKLVVSRLVRQVWISQRVGPTAPFKSMRFQSLSSLDLIAPDYSKLARSSLSTSVHQQQSKGAQDTTKSTGGNEKKKSTSDDNWFFDNLGKIFLAIIAGVVATLVRSSYNTGNRNALRDKLEQQALLDPCEIDDLRVANSELTPDVFRAIMNDVIGNFRGDMSCSYEDFVAQVKDTMTRLKGDAFTVELGHLLERPVIKYLENNDKSEYDELPLAMWLTFLSMAVNSTPRDRIQVLFEVLERTSAQDAVNISRIRELVGYLQESDQLPPDTQLVATDVKFPTQQWRRANPEDLVPWSGQMTDAADLDAFASIIRSSSVCAWGECYHKAKFAPFASTKET